MKAKTGNKDVFTYEVLRSLLESIPREMAEVLKRTSYHPIFNEVLDFSTALLTAEGELAAQFVGVPVHLGALEACARAIINRFGADGFKPSDIIIHNNPFPGGSHLPDVDILAPVFYKGKLVMFAVARGHHGDIGGAHPGSFAGDSTSIFQEGVRMPPIKLYEAGKLAEGVKDLLLANVHMPNYTWGDLQAQVAACHIGEKRLSEMFEKYGSEAVAQSINWSFDRSEQLMRAEIDRWAEGFYTFTDYLDNDGIDKDRPVKIHVKITVKGSDITFDFNGSDKQVRGPANCVMGNLTSAVYTALFNLTERTIPKNHGCYRPVTIIAPEGLVVNAKYPAPVVSGNTETTLRVIDTITGAMAKVMPEKVVAACSGTTSNVIWGGVDPRTDEPYALYLGGFGGGGGARATKDGWGPQGGSQIGGANGQIPIEEVETKFPFFIEEASLVLDSGGPGRFRGGQVELWRMRIVGHICEMGGCQDRSIISPYGLFGGMPGLHGDNHIVRKNGEIIAIDRSGGVMVAPEDEIHLRFPGGGGYGDPLGRNLDYLQNDIDHKIVSVESARRDYGAVVDAKGKIDRAATEANRKKLKPRWKRDEIFIDQWTKPFARKQFRLIHMNEEVK